MNEPVTIVGKRFAALRRERYLTQEEFAQRLEMSPANVRRLEQSPISGMQVKNFRRLAGLLNIAPDELRRRIGAPRGEARDSTERIPQARGAESTRPAAPMPESTIHDAEFPAGVGGPPRETVDITHFHGVSAARIEDRTATARGAVPAPPGPRRRFAVTVDGDCMAPRYQHGDIVVFSVDAAEREGIVEGKNYFIQFVDGENSFKRIFLDPESRDRVILRCWNERYAPRIVERNRIKLLARAVYRLQPDE